jgi:hypothetical protein
MYLRGTKLPPIERKSPPENVGLVVKADGFQTVGQIWPDVGFVL